MVVLGSNILGHSTSRVVFRFYEISIFLLLARLFTGIGNRDAIETKVLCIRHRSPRKKREGRKGWSPVKCAAIKESLAFAFRDEKLAETELMMKEQSSPGRLRFPSDVSFRHGERERSRGNRERERENSFLARVYFHVRMHLTRERANFRTAGTPGVSVSHNDYGPRIAHRADRPRFTYGLREFAPRIRAACATRTHVRSDVRLYVRVRETISRIPDATT